MAKINLLPWRAERRKQREREFYMMLAVTAVAAILAVLGAVGWMGHLIDGQNARNAYLEGEIKGLERKIEEIKELDKTRAQLLTRKEIIEQLQSNRAQMVHLFDELVKTIPDGSRLTTMKQVGEQMTLEGMAESNSRVATYMRNLDRSPWMGQTDLRKTENRSDSKDVNKKLPYTFTLEVKLRKPDEAQKQEEDEASKPEAGRGDGVETKQPADLGAQLDAAATKLMNKPATKNDGADQAQPAGGAK